jgi:uncharacterized protein (TIGR02594 family)
MSLSRRNLLARAALGALAGALGQGRAAQPSLQDGIGITPDYAGPLPAARLGTQHPLTAEELVAKAILDEAPDGPAPIDVARYFLDVANGAHGVDWKPYASGWPTRWNPLIVTFFSATGTKPSGDTTPWCAAFVNWCFLQATKSRATGSASSGSFRCFDSATSTPEPGDVVVFRRKDANEECSGSGHVGFFLGQTDSSVEVLGGNQIDGHTGCHSISSRMFAKSGSMLVFHSYRARIITSKEK